MFHLRLRCHCFLLHATDRPWYDNPRGNKRAENRRSNSLIGRLQRARHCKNQDIAHRRVRATLILLCSGVLIVLLWVLHAWHVILLLPAVPLTAKVSRVIRLSMKECGNQEGLGLDSRNKAPHVNINHNSYNGISKVLSENSYLRYLWQCSGVIWYTFFSIPKIKMRSKRT